MSAPFMQLYVADYLGDTRHLTTEQHGAYLLLLMTMWRSDGRLPNDPKKLARIAGCSPSRWAKIADEVLEFFTVEGAELTNHRLTIELEKSSEKSIKRAVSGSRGGKAKALKTNKTDVANATVLPEHSSDIRYQTPSSPPGGTKSPKATSDQVEAIWSQCPPKARERSSRADVELELNSALRRGKSVDQVLAGLLAAYRSDTYAGDRAKGIHRLIMKDRWASFTEAAGSPSDAPARTFDGPPELRAAVVRERDEDYARRWIDHYCRWRPADRTLLARSATVAAAITRDLSAWLDRAKVRVEVDAANTDTPLVAQGDAA
ncbi:YdaU family protein [Brevundimonas sp. Root1279]|uniref:YdaU family protein n=1 Tax=Brevundimonas sp. Root1279 TaxID=1736443 RepID=UPI000713A0EE|nr:DUF1376 domain-containing protein [Brevundimonas sp. Root1279]KQW79730.1 hypothetical protein ASC65_14375 [Brevundimonas sp. Root1279]